MGYAEKSDESFIKTGEKTSLSLRSIMADKNIVFNENSAVMEWGCATGRVLRHFAKEAEECEFWGIDQDEKSIIWAKQNLSPPFKFLTCSSYPHLPFQDSRFSFIFGISVFTHIRHLQDNWLMELNRVLRKGGYAVFTINDENTIKYFIEKGERHWIPPKYSWKDILTHDVVIVPGSVWWQTFTIFKTDWIKKEWGRYFDVVDIRPYAEGYQSAVVLKKP